MLHCKVRWTIHYMTSRLGCKYTVSFQVHRLNKLEGIINEKTDRWTRHYPCHTFLPQGIQRSAIAVRITNQRGREGGKRLWQGLSRSRRRGRCAGRERNSRSDSVIRRTVLHEREEVQGFIEFVSFHTRCHNCIVLRGGKQEEEGGRGGRKGGIKEGRWGKKEMRLKKKSNSRVTVKRRMEW